MDGKSRPESSKHHRMLTSINTEMTPREAFAFFVVHSELLLYILGALVIMVAICFLIDWLFDRIIRFIVKRFSK